MTDGIVATLLVNAAVFSALFAVMLLVRRLLAGRMSAALRYALWAVVAVKLLIPFGFESPWKLPAWAEVRGSEPIAAAAQTAAPVTNPADSSVLADDDLTLPAESGLNTDPIHQPEIIPVQTEIPSELRGRLNLSWTAWALMIWGAGAAAAAGWLLAGIAGLRRHIRRGGREVPRVFAAVLDDCRRELGIGRAIGVCFLPGAAIPAVTGILRPTLLLPDSLRETGARELRPILLHELTHYRHGDLWVMGLQNVLTAIYWFNPLTWWCFALMRRDMETLCDQRVLALLDGERQQYIHAILSYTTPGSGGRFRAALGLGDGHARLERRIREMFGHRRSGRRTRTAAVALTAVMLAAGLLTACQPTPGESAVQQKDSRQLEDMIQATADGQGSQTPDHYTDTFAGAEDTVTFVIDADVVRQGEAMPVVEVKPYAIPMDQIKAMAQVLFQGNTAYEPQVTLTKSDIDQKIVEIRQYINDNQNMGDEYKALYEQYIAEYQKQYADAPDAVEQRQTDWTFHPEAYYMDAMPGIPGELRSQSDTIMLNARVEGYQALLHINNLETDDYIEHGISFLMGSDSPFGLIADARPLTMTAGEAEAMVQDALGRMGITNMRLTACTAYGKPEPYTVPDLGLGKDGNALHAAAGEGEDGSPAASITPGPGEVYSYSMTFVPACEGVTTVNANHIESSEDEYGPSYLYEELMVRVQNDIITYLIWSSPVQTVRVENENVAIISLDEAAAAFIKRMQQQYTLSELAGGERYGGGPYEDRVEAGRVRITGIRLGLMRIHIKDRPGVYRMVPVWTFDGYEELDVRGMDLPMPGPRMDTRTGEAFTYAVVNAIDGTIIDPALGY